MQKHYAIPIEYNLQSHRWILGRSTLMEAQDEAETSCLFRLVAVASDAARAVMDCFARFETTTSTPLVPFNLATLRRGLPPAPCLVVYPNLETHQTMQWNKILSLPGERSLLHLYLLILRSGET
jgi:hypothetical protein